MPAQKQGVVTTNIFSNHKTYYSQVPIKQVGWEKVRVEWRANTFFLSLCRFLSVCYPTCTFSTLLVYLAPECKLDLNLHYGPHYKPHYRTQGCVIRENDFTAPLRTYFNPNGSVRWRTSVYLNLLHWLMGKNSCNCNGICRYV